jgi:alkaline phosphatase
MKTLPTASRRQFLKLSGLAGAVSMLPVGAAQAASHAQAIGRAKNIIFLVVDGLCNGTVGLAHHWKLRNQKSDLNWIQLMSREGVHRCYQDTASASSPVTDSSAASSAWGGGQRVANGALNVTPDGEFRKPILAYAKEADKATGLVSTCRISHATPAGFAANAKSRNEEDAIVKQYFEREIDVLLGGGARHFTQKNKKGRRVEYIPRFVEKGYTYVKNKTELAAAASGSGSLLGLFAPSHIPYAIDRENERPQQDIPSLGDMFRAALTRLSQADNGFVLQVEGGRVDHAAHANDAGAILHEFLEFDACIPIALEYIEAHPDTMLIVTTDHGTGGCQLNGAGKRYRESGPALERINQLKFSYEWLQNRLYESAKFDSKYVQQALGIDSDQEQAARVQAAMDAKKEYLSDAFSEAYGAELEKRTAVGWSTGNHTSECVELFAFGPGAELIPSFVKNYEMFNIMLKQFHQI